MSGVLHATYDKGDLIEITRAPYWKPGRDGRQPTPRTLTVGSVHTVTHVFSDDVVSVEPGRCTFNDEWYLHFDCISPSEEPTAAEQAQMDAEMDAAIRSLTGGTSA